MRPIGGADTHYLNKRVRFGMAEPPEALGIVVESKGEMDELSAIISPRSDDRRQSGGSAVSVSSLSSPDMGLDPVKAVVLVRDALDATQARVLLPSCRCDAYTDGFGQRRVVKTEEDLALAAKEEATEELRLRSDHAAVSRVVLVFDTLPIREGDEIPEHLEPGQVLQLRSPLQAASLQIELRTADGKPARKTFYALVTTFRASALGPAAQTIVAGNSSINSMLDEAFSAPGQGDPLVRLVKIAGGADYIHSNRTINFASHAFQRAHFNERPAGVKTLLTEWAFHARKSIPSDTKKFNPLWTTSAAPGCGKSHLIDELHLALTNPKDKRHKQMKKMKTETTCVFSHVVSWKISFNNGWTPHREIEGHWTRDQAIIGRILCCACNCKDWRGFAEWFGTSELRHLTLQSLIKPFMGMAVLIVLLVDESLLFRSYVAAESQGTEVQQLYHLIAEASDSTFSGDTPMRLIPFVTALHNVYAKSIATSTGRDIERVDLTRLDPRTVVETERWGQYAETFSAHVVQLLFDMCSGHPRSIETIDNFLARLARANRCCESLSAYLAAASLKFHTKLQGMWAGCCTLRYLCPVFLELPLPTFTGAGEEVQPTEASLLVKEGFYINELNTSADFFVPVITGWTLYHFLLTTSLFSGTLSGIQEALSQQTAEAVDNLLPRLLHLRFIALLETQQSLKETFGAHPPAYHPLMIRGLGATMCGLIELRSQEQCFNFRTLFDQLALPAQSAVTNAIYQCDKFPNLDAEQAAVHFDNADIAQTLFISVTDQNNRAVDWAVRTWVVSGTPNQRTGVTFLGQDKKRDAKHLSVTEIRRALKKLQEVATKYLARRPRRETEQVVLVLVLICTEDKDIDVARLLANAHLNEAHTVKPQKRNRKGKSQAAVAAAESAEESKEEAVLEAFAPVDFPVIFLGRDDVCGMLGKGLEHYLRARLAAGHRSVSTWETIRQKRPSPQQPQSELPPRKARHGNP